MKFSLDLPRMGYMMLVRHEKGWIGNNIVKEQMKNGYKKKDAQYTHIAVCGGGQWVVDPIPPRIKISNITKRYKGRYIKIIKYKHPTFEKKRYKVAFWSATSCNLGYDWLGVIRFKLKFLWHHKRMFFCSENALFSLQKEYPEAMKGLRPEDCMPADFTGNDFVVVWEGIINS